MTSRYGAGDHALFRFVWPWRVFWALPATVVEHTAHRVALWAAPNTPMRRPSAVRVPLAQIASGEWVDEEATWFGGGRLFLARTGAAHSICPSWRANGSFIGWYVNLEDPWRRSPLGFDTTDHALDIWVLPDRSWRWKDEDELQEAVGVGLFTQQQAKAIREEGDRVIERVEAWTEPFNEGWEEWRPNPDWALPSVPEGWDRL